MTYPYVPARYLYGVRKGPTLALMLHGSESEAGLVGYLSRKPARGVSANFACEHSGRMVRMTGLEDASGSLNPKDRSSDKAYYGQKHLRDVLGKWWFDPNSVVISVEIEMYAAKGPNPDQVASLVRWAADMKARFPTIRGALGHADQTDTKGCPGTTPAMRSVFGLIGGHGLWTAAPQEVAIVDIAPLTYHVTIEPKGSKPITGSLGGDVIYKTKAGDAFPLVGSVSGFRVLRMPGDVAGYLANDDVFRETPVAAPPPVNQPQSADCAAAVTTAIDHIEGAVAGVLTAIKEARPEARP